MVQGLMRWVVVLGLGASAAWATSGSAAENETSVTDETPLHENMERMEDSLKKLRRGLRKPENNAESLEQVTTMFEASMVCKGLIPQMAESQPEAERAAFVTAYRKRMAQSMIDMLHLEIALLDNDNEAAQEIYKKLKIHEDEGHEEFTEDG